MGAEGEKEKELIKLFKKLPYEIRQFSFQTAKLEVATLSPETSQKGRYKKLLAILGYQQMHVFLVASPSSLACDRR